MSRRFGVVSRLAKDDVWMLRRFCSESDKAQLAERETAQAIIDLGWDKGEVALVTFELDALTRLESFRDRAGAIEGEVALMLDRERTFELGIKAHQPARRVGKVVAP